MSVVMEGDRIHLRESCPVGEAETLLTLLLDHPDVAVDLSAAGPIHTALWQVLLLCRPRIVGETAGQFGTNWLLPRYQAFGGKSQTG